MSARQPLVKVHSHECTSGPCLRMPNGNGSGSCGESGGAGVTAPTVEGATTVGSGCPAGSSTCPQPTSRRKLPTSSSPNLVHRGFSTVSPIPGYYQHNMSADHCQAPAP